MAGADEVEVLAGALSALGVDGAEVDVLADHPGRRRVVRAGDAVVKAFSAAEEAAWRREVAGLRAVAGFAWAPAVVATGERWTATRWIDGVVPMDAAVGNAEIHTAIGPALAALHAVAPKDLAPWPLVDRLRRYLAAPPPTCPPALAAAVGRIVSPLFPLVRQDTFVHGDWGTANVLVGRDRLTEVVAVIDFEDAHVGDPAEDLKWQVLSGPASEELAALGASYRAASGDLGRHGTERLVVAGAELCLDVLGWANLSRPSPSASTPAAAPPSRSSSPVTGPTGRPEPPLRSVSIFDPGGVEYRHRTSRNGIAVTPARDRRPMPFSDPSATIERSTHLPRSTGPRALRVPGPQGGTPS